MHLLRGWAGVIVLSSLPLAAQTAPEPIKIGSVVVSGSIRSRVENWNWFTPNSGNPDYTFLGSQARLGFSRNGDGMDWNLEFEVPFLLGLPENAVAPGAQGQLGMGASYYVSNDRNRNAAMIYPKQAWMRFKNLFGSTATSLRVGRFEFMDGGEVNAKNATLGVIKRDRVQQRLIGPFGFTHVMRSFDGLHFVYSRPKINYTIVAAIPTRGVFQVDGWGWLNTGFVYAAATGQVEAKKNTGEWRLFGIFYDDWRNTPKQDNRAAVPKSADHGIIQIETFGGHYVHVAETSAGPIDLLALGAGQVGKWGVLDHRAGMADFEAGWQPKILPRLKPWIRGGYFYSTGDGNPNDGQHSTFFQLLPTARPFARFPFFNMMNNTDRFGMLTVRPHKKLVIKTEEHFLRLTSRDDLWYIGGGAFQPWTFGYQSRSGSGAAGLGTLYDVSGDVTVNPHFAFTAYWGYCQGKSVIQSVYPLGKDGHLGFLEFNIKF